MASKRPETAAAQALGDIDPVTGAVVPPIHVATTYERAPDLAYPLGYCYARPDNATTRHVERVLTELEGGAASLAFASGSAAATALVLAMRAAGSAETHVVAPKVMYWSLRKWLAEDARAFGIRATFVDMTDLTSVERAVEPGRTALVWIETPSNPLWGVTDIAAVAAIAHAAGAILAVDSTAATPVLTRPLALGADVVMHSATKYLNGHSDVLAGTLTFAAAGPLLERSARVRATLGAILGPFESALLLRGMRTLYVRVGRQCETAIAIARHFLGHPGVVEVQYPGLGNAPDHEIARKQMTGGFGGMLSLRIAGGEPAAVAVAARLAVWKRATSLGGVESLVEHRASIEGPGTPCPSDLLRLSVGLEATDDLIADLEQAIRAR